MKINNSKTILTAAVFCAFLSACGGGVKEQLGLDKQVPDEFAVVKRAPLTLPPDYHLRPPRPGAPRPQEQTTATQARQTVFGENSESQNQQNTTSSAEDIFLSRAGANQASSSIRRQVDKESATLKDENAPVAKKILNIATGNDEPHSTLVDPKKETERLRQNAKDGKSVTEGETPVLDD